MKKTKVLALVLVLALALGLAACGGGTTSSTPAPVEPTDSSPAVPESTPAVSPDAATPVVVKVGVVGEDSLMWPPVIEALKAEGIEIELVKFGEYSLPNEALNSGEIDLNAFQHYAYLDDEVANKGYKISAIGDTYISPQNIYSTTITSLDDLKEGDTVIIPDDQTNGGRALKVLESAGLITVDPAKGYQPEVKDITGNPKNLVIQEVDAANVYSLLPDAGVGVINANYALDSGLSPSVDALFVETFASEGESKNPYINVLVARDADLTNEVYLKVLAAYQSQGVETIFATEYKGAYLPGWK